MGIRTKIICTIGPSVDSYEKILQLVDAGMNVARLNFSHGDYLGHERVIAFLKQARAEKKVPLAIMLDTKGPEVRVGPIQDGLLRLSPGQKLLLTHHEVMGNAEKIPVRPGNVLANIEVGALVLFDDGYISSTVKEKVKDGIIVTIENGGVLKSGKGINFPYAKLNLPFLTEKDIADITFAAKHNLEYIAASFVRCAEDLLAIKNLLADLEMCDTLVIAKIENHQGVENFDSIVQVADGIMVARGDLGVEVPLTKVPKLQKMMIRKCYLAGKPAITATQMLESMILNPRPTRAETSDVANAIYDSTSAAMLSGETAVGSYPAKTVEMMKNIILEAEDDFDYQTFFNLHSTLAYNDVTSSVTLAAVKTAYSSNAKAIFAFTSSGGTSRLISRLRPKMPILAMTEKEKTYHQMALNWGVIPVLSKGSKDIIQAFGELSDYALNERIVQYGDLIVMTAGSTFGFSGSTNMMVVESIGYVLVRGNEGAGPKIYGKATLLHTLEGKHPYEVQDKIIVIARAGEAYIPFIHQSAGVILQNHIDDLESEAFVMRVGKEMEKSVLVRGDNAFNVLKEGQLITLDPGNCTVYKGVVASKE